MQKILIIQTAFIGDVVLATGIAEKLHQFYPSTQINFLVRKGNESLFDSHPFIQQVLVWDKKKGKYKNLLKLIAVIQKEKYDLVINAQRYAATGLITILSNAKQTIGFDKNPFSFLFTKTIKHFFSNTTNSLHEIDRNHLLIKHLTDAKAAKPKLYPTSISKDLIKKYQSQEYVCIAPASVWFTKQFPSEKWIDFINALPSHFNVYLLGAPNDRGLCSAIQSVSQHQNVMNLAGELSFLASAALMQNAVMNYVNDSAPMHLASAVNAPVTAVFCSTLPSFGYGPLSDKSFVVEINEHLSCRPCGIHGKKACPQHHFNCAMKITNQQLLVTLYA
jgi:heptosyltransferase-2